MFHCAMGHISAPGQIEMRLPATVRGVTFVTYREATRKGHDGKRETFNKEVARKLGVETASEVRLCTDDAVKFFEEEPLFEDMDKLVLSYLDRKGRLLETVVTTTAELEAAKAKGNWDDEAVDEFDDLY